MANPDLDALIAAAMAHHRAGRLTQAEEAYRAVLAVRPDHAGALHNLGVIVAESGRTDEAIALFDRAIAIEPAYALAHFNRANALRATGDVQGAAVEAYRQTVSLAPDHYDAHRALAFLWMAQGRRDRALDHFARTLELRRGADRIGIADTSLQYATRAKLRHDADQLRYLAGLGRDSQRFELLARTYEGVANDIDSPGAVRLSDDHLDGLGETYNLPFHVIDAPELTGPAVNPALDVAAITDAWSAAAPGIAWFDGLLTDGALRLLRRFLLESTIWFDFSHIDGFLAAYLEDGLACPLILQIADELRAALPAIFAGHALVQGWAFKGLRGDVPIAPHADDAAISVNFWATPDEASTDPDRGGLMICRAPPPAGRTIAGYDDDRDEIGRFLRKHAADRLIVPYRENRAVLFESRLFHGSDAPDFAPGYENHRINITLLYG
jgi:tetratricopeptide (TPR) repeat protein